MSVRPSPDKSGQLPGQLVRLPLYFVYSPSLWAFKKSSTVNFPPSFRSSALQLQLQAKLGPDHIESEPIGTLTIDVRALFAAVWTYRRSDAAERVEAMLSDPAQAADRLRMWVTGIGLNELDVRGMASEELAECRTRGPGAVPADIARAFEGSAS